MSPGDVLVWERIAVCWLEAWFVFLPRHAAAVAASPHS
jgi:hypothetical protein